ncbi:MAG: asparaginase, partial [Lachnospiraceae bacterium]|nr:asparaginase [Lachnospiraceae bacterium]
MKKICLIATGGTIGAKDGGNGVEPELTPQELLSYVPELKEIAQISVRELYRLDSTNIHPEHWLGMAGCIREEYGNFDGFVVIHGTDTMAYTAAALSYLVQNSKKPIILTGSQKSVYNRDTDARRNLIDAFCYAADMRSHGVYIVFDGTAILGTHARKTRTHSYNAFSSINCPEAAVVQEGRVIRYFEPECGGEVRFYDRMNPRVLSVRPYPGISPEILTRTMDCYDGLVIECFGTSGIPAYGGFDTALKAWAKAGKVIVATTQVPHEGSDMSVYRVGKDLMDLGLLEAFDMTPEAVLAKLMWALGNAGSRKEMEEKFAERVWMDTFRG